jgi:hypothetical protein
MPRGRHSQGSSGASSPLHRETAVSSRPRPAQPQLAPPERTLGPDELELSIPVFYARCGLPKRWQYALVPSDRPRRYKPLIVGGRISHRLRQDAMIMLMLDNHRNLVRVWAADCIDQALLACQYRLPEYGTRLIADSVRAYAHGHITHEDFSSAIIAALPAAVPAIGAGFDFDDDLDGDSPGLRFMQCLWDLGLLINQDAQIDPDRWPLRVQIEYVRGLDVQLGKLADQAGASNPADTLKIADTQWQTARLGAYLTGRAGRPPEQRLPHLLAPEPAT